MLGYTIENNEVHQSLFLFLVYKKKLYFFINDSMKNFKIEDWIYVDDIIYKDFLLMVGFNNKKDLPKNMLRIHGWIKKIIDFWQ